MKRRLSGLRVGMLIVVAGSTFLFQAQVGAAVQKDSAQKDSAQKGSVLTPRTTDGRPDLSGMWNPQPAAYRGTGSVSAEQRANGISYASRRCAPNQKGCRENTNQNIDDEFMGRISANRPLYKPEYWDKVQDTDYNTNNTDPMFQCLPDGVPRVGPPAKIVQTATELIFFYTSGRNHDYRIIPIDGRAHDPVLSQDIGFYGDAIGTWEGDTLVVDSKGFTDATWLSNKGGYFHSDKLHVIERFRREGNRLHYEVTVEDPEVLLQPWVMDPQTLTLNPNPKAVIFEGDVCRDFDLGTHVSRIRH